MISNNSKQIFSFKEKKTSLKTLKVPLESFVTLLFFGSNFPILLVVLPSVPLIPQKLGVHPFGGSVAMPPGLLDVIYVGLVELVMCCVIFRKRKTI